MSLIHGIITSYRGKFINALIDTIVTLCLLIALALLSMAQSSGAYADTTHTSSVTASELQQKTPHYLIPGFSSHLIAANLMVYRDLRLAEHADSRHDTLKLRIALADANGHLMQMATPSALTDLHDRVIRVENRLKNNQHGGKDSAWKALFASIDHLAVPSVDHLAHKRLLKIADHAHKLAQEGQIKAAHAQIKRLIAKIDITAHVYPIKHLRSEVNSAVTFASHGGPLWVKAKKAIQHAIHDTRWLINPTGRHMMHAYDAAVTAYASWPNTRIARHSLEKASWYLRHVSHMHSLERQFYSAAHNHKLTIDDITHLQDALAVKIQRSRNKTKHH